MAAHLISGGEPFSKVRPAMLFKNFLIWSSGCPVQWSEIIYVLLEWDTCGYFKFGPVAQEMSFIKKVYELTIHDRQRQITLAPFEHSVHLN